MDEEKLIEKLGSLKCPEMQSPLRQQRLKLVLTNARRSSWIGVVCVAFPSLFILGVLLKYGFGLDMPLFSALEEKMAQIDHSTLHFLSPFVMAGAPLAALVLNLLAIMHFHFDRARAEFQFSVKLRIVNLIIIATCLFILAMLFVHAVAESGHHHRARFSNENLIWIMHVGNDGRITGLEPQPEWVAATGGRLKYQIAAAVKRLHDHQR